MDCVEYYRKISTYSYKYIYIVYIYMKLYIRLYIYIWNNIYTNMYFTSKLSECWWFLFPTVLGKRVCFFIWSPGCFLKCQGSKDPHIFFWAISLQKSHNKKDVTLTVYEKNVSFFKFFPSHQVTNNIWKPRLPGQTHPCSNSIGTFLSCVALGGNDAGATGKDAMGPMGWCLIYVWWWCNEMDSSSPISYKLIWECFTCPRSPPNKLQRKCRPWVEKKNI